MKRGLLKVNIFGEKSWWSHADVTNPIFRYKYNHNNYGPAFIEIDCRGWVHRGKLHRIDGPAVEYASGNNVYFINDILYDNYLEYLVAVEEYRK